MIVSRDSIKFKTQRVPLSDIQLFEGEEPIIAPTEPSLAGKVPAIEIPEMPDIVKKESVKLKFPEDTPETLLFEAGQDASALANVFVPSLSPLAVAPLGEATPFIPEVALPETGMRDEPFANLSRIINLGLMATPGGQPFVVLAMAREAVKGKEQPMLRGEVEPDTGPDTPETLFAKMSLKPEDRELFTTIVTDLELLYLTQIGVKGIAEGVGALEKYLGKRRNIKAKTVRQFMGKSLENLTKKEVEQIIAARNINKNISGLRLLEELKAEGLTKEAEKWYKYMFERRMSAGQSGVTIRGKGIKGKLPRSEVSTITPEEARGHVDAIVKQRDKIIEATVSPQKGIFDIELRNPKTGEYTISGEGPFETLEDAIEFGKSEVGARHRVVNTETGEIFGEGGVAKPELELVPELIAKETLPKPTQDRLDMDIGQALFPESGLGEGRKAVNETEIESRIAEIEADRQQTKLALGELTLEDALQRTYELDAELMELETQVATQGMDPDFGNTIERLIREDRIYMPPKDEIGKRGGEYDGWQGIAGSKFGERIKFSFTSDPKARTIDEWVIDKADQLKSLGITDVSSFWSKMQEYAANYTAKVKPVSPADIELLQSELLEERDVIEQWWKNNRPEIYKKVKDNFTAENIQVALIEDVLNKGTAGITITESAESAAEVAAKEAELADVVTEVEGIAPPPGGLAIRETGIPRPPEFTADDYTFDDPVVEKRYADSHGVTSVPLSEKIDEVMTVFKNRLTRAFEHLEAGAEFAEIKLLLTRLQKQRSISFERAVDILEGVTKKLDKVRGGLFDRKILLDDLAFEVAQRRTLPLGFTPESVVSELAKVDALLAKDPVTSDAILKRNEFMDALRSDYGAIMERVGNDAAKRFANPKYFRHQVLLYSHIKGAKGSGKLKTPTSRPFLKERKGGDFDINTNYLEVEHEVIAMMLHDIEVANVLEYVEKNFDISKAVKLEAKEAGTDWRASLPEGQALWQPREGNLFYFADSIPSKIADALMEGGLKEFNLTKDEISKVMAVGGRRKELVIPEALKKTLDDPFPDQNKGTMAKVSKMPIQLFKRLALAAPRRLMKFMFRNLTGDAEAVFIGNARSFKDAPEATKELYQVLYGDGAMSNDMRDWFKRGGWESTLAAQETEAINRLPNFKHIRDVKTPVSEMPVKVWKSYWSMARRFIDFRESVLRLANYKSYLRQMEASPTGRPLNFGASLQEEIMAITDIKDRAYKLSNDLLGAYDEITVTGRHLREHWIPFWSFQEINMRRYYRLMRNAWQDDDVAGMVGRKVLAKGLNPMTYVRVGKFVLMATAMWTATQTWNTTLYPLITGDEDIEGELPEEVASRPHIIFGRDKDGKPIYFSRIGILGDFLEMFGLDEFPTHVEEWLKNRKTLKEVATEMAKSPVNKVTQGARPFIKLIAELASRRSFFPDVFEPRTIRDRGYHIARFLTLEKEYVELMRLPSRGYQNTMMDFFVYRTDPGQGSYSRIIDKKNKFLKKLGKGGEGFFISPKGNALYNFKLAVKLGDEEAKKEWLEQYIKLSGITNKKKLAQTIKRSLEAADPLWGLKQKEKLVFIASLDEEERKHLTRAIHFYHEVLLGKGEK